MFTFAILTFPLYSVASSSRTGAIILQGPHHSAQKSTSTGSAELSTASLKFDSLAVITFSEAIISPSPKLVDLPQEHKPSTSHPKLTRFTTSPRAPAPPAQPPP